MASLLKKFVDRKQWEAEDIVGRLGMVLHGAFLFAGFQPYDDAWPLPSSGHRLKQSADKAAGNWLCLSRRYTAPELAPPEARGCCGADARCRCAGERRRAPHLPRSEERRYGGEHLQRAPGRGRDQPAPISQLQGRGALGVADLQVPRQWGVLGLARLAVP